MGKDMFGRKPAAGGGLSAPCAACKLLRRRCAAGCVFAPYFPADEPQKFANVHRVFGASNVSKLLQVYLSPSLTLRLKNMRRKLLQEVAVEQRTDAVSSLVYEANARVRDPVYGCVASISSLQCQIDILRAQLAVAQAEMVRIRLHHAAHLASITPHAGNTASSATTTPSDIASEIPAEKPLFRYDMLLEHANAGQPMWSY